MAKRIGIWLFIAFAAGIAALHLYWLVRGIATGAIPTLHKSSDATIRYAASPGIFILNMALRGLIAALFGGWSAVATALRRLGQCLIPPKTYYFWTWPTVSGYCRNSKGSKRSPEEVEGCLRVPCAAKVAELWMSSR